MSTGTATGTGTTLGSPLSRLARIGVARGHVELLQFSRERDSMVFIFGFPIVLLLIFGSVFADEIAPGVLFRQYFTAGMIASGLMITSFQSLAIQIAIYTSLNAHVPAAWDAPLQCSVA